MKKICCIVGIIATVLLAGCGDKESYLNKAQVSLEGGKYEEALESYNKAIMEDEDLGLSYRGAGICSFMMGDYEKAEDYFVRALRESEGIVGELEIDLSYYLAETYVCLGQNDKALETYTNILNYDDTHTDARVYRGVLYIQNGEVDKAKKDFKRAVQGKNNNLTIGTYYKIYEALAACGDEEAQKYLEKGLECKEEGKEDIYMKGCMYDIANDSGKALEYLQKSKEAGYGKASFKMGEIYEKQGDLATAASCYNDYIKVSNVEPEEYVQIINCKINMGDMQGAKEDCENAVANADESQLQYMKFQQIVALEKMGEFQEAKEKMVQYLTEYPDDEKAQRESEFLQTR